jgi:hypothetical protein
MSGEFERDLRAMMREKGIDVDGPIDPSQMLTAAAKMREVCTPLKAATFRLVRLDQDMPGAACFWCGSKEAAHLVVIIGRRDQQRAFGYEPTCSMCLGTLLEYYDRNR